MTEVKNIATRKQVSTKAHGMAGLTASTPTKKALLFSIVQGLCRVLVVRGFGFKAYGLENIPRTGGVLLASNHQSYLDPILLTVHLPRPITYFAKAYLFKNPIFGWFILSLHAFPVEPGKGDRAAVNTAIAKLREGHMLTIFPEGHRSADGKIGPFERGAALIARRAGVPVVPVAIDGAFDAWPRQCKVFRTRPVHLMYGKPIDPAGMGADEFLKVLETEIHRLFAELQEKRQRSGWYDNG